MVPASLQMLLMHPRCASVDYSRLKYILYGAAPIPLELLRQCIQVFGADFIKPYGRTERPATTPMLPPEAIDPAANAPIPSRAKALPGVEFVIPGPAGQRVPPGWAG